MSTAKFAPNRSVDISVVKYCGACKETKKKELGTTHHSTSINFKGNVFVKLHYVLQVNEKDF